MDIEKLREFSILSETRSFTKAARLLNISQSALSKHVRALEHEVGFHVLERNFSNKDAQLTPAGAVLLKWAHGIVDNWERALAESREIARTPAPAKIQGLYYCINLNPQIRQALDRCQDAPDRLYRYVDVDVDVRDALDRGLADFVIHHEPQPEMIEFAAQEDTDAYRWIALEGERLCFVAGTGNPLARKERVSLREVMGLDIVNQMSPSFSSWYSSLSAILVRHGVTPRLKLTANNPCAGMALPIGDSSVFLCTERMATWYRELGVESTTVLAVTDFDEMVYCFLVYRRDNQNQNVERMVRCLRGQA